MNQKITEIEKREQLELFLNGWDLTTETNEKLVKKIESGDLIKIDYRNGKLGNCEHGPRFLIVGELYRDPYCNVCDHIITKIAKNRVNVYHDSKVSKYATKDDISKHTQEALELAEERFLKRFNAHLTKDEVKRLFEIEEIGSSIFEQLDTIENMTNVDNQTDYLHLILDQFSGILEIEKNEKSGKLKNLNNDELRHRIAWIEKCHTSKQDAIDKQAQKISKTETKLQKLQKEQDELKACLVSWEKDYSDLVSEWKNRLHS